MFYAVFEDLLQVGSYLLCYGESLLYFEVQSREIDRTLEDIPLDGLDCFVSLRPEGSIVGHLQVSVVLLTPLLQISDFTSDVYLAPARLVSHPIEFLTTVFVFKDHVVVCARASLHLNELAS